jgi:hypothetical protein
MTIWATRWSWWWRADSGRWLNARAWISYTINHRLWGSHEGGRWHIIVGGHEWGEFLKRAHHWVWVIWVCGYCRCNIMLYHSFFYAFMWVKLASLENALPKFGIGLVSLNAVILILLIYHSVNLRKRVSYSVWKIFIFYLQVVSYLSWEGLKAVEAAIKVINVVTVVSFILISLINKKKVVKETIRKFICFTFSFYMN